MNYYEHHIGDYDKATAHLTACEDGIYSRLLRRYYDTEAPLPADIKSLQRLVRARAKDEREAVETVLHEFFELDATGWRHTRCDAEIARYQEKRTKAKRSAEARWSKQNEDAENMRTHSERNANASTEHDERNAHQSPDTRHQKQEQKPLVRQAARFAEFWAAYPVKKGRAEAEAKWKARGLDSIADRIIADVQARKVSDRQWLDGYAPHGSTYVNGRGWEDEIEARKVNGAAGTTSGYVPLPVEF